MHGVFLDYETVSNGDLDTTGLVEAAGEVRFFASTADAEMDARLAEAQIVLSNKAKLTRERLSAAPRLRLVALAATGTDKVDLTAAQERGIAVCNVRAYCTSSVVQHAWSLILGLTQHLAQYSRLATDGSWVRREGHTVLAHPIRELAGRTLGIIGWGTLGRGVADAAPAFGMRTLVCNRPGAPPQPGRVALDELLATADVVSLHCPLTPATRGLIGARELGLMKPDALLVNTARGALVDTHALAEALRRGKLGGAGIDVLPQEPPVDGDPLLDPTLPNLILTPHVAWAAREARQRCLDEMAANIRDFLAGGRRGRVV
jgi:glycerate dehydrogenase